jgi:hypothetical protein
MHLTVFGIAFSRRDRTQLLARPHRVSHETPIDHLPPVRTVRRGPRPSSWASA